MTAVANNPTNSEWWRGAVLYQVYLRSFQDGNGDGIGDLPGLLQRLSYIAGLGVDGLWIGPFFPSPMRDFGYDVQDYRAVDPRFGTLDDLRAVVEQAHALGLKVLIDQVWSHTAMEHPWFAESRASRTGPKAHWYVWADAKPDGSPPTNWQSWMGGPAWRWEPRRGQYHLHQFLPQMPDLNFHEPQVQEAVLACADFWWNLGIDGFRLDTANLYAHDRQLRDNPPLPPELRGASPALMQEHRYTMNQPESLAFVARLRAQVEERARAESGAHPGRLLVGEIGGHDAVRTMQAYTRGTDHLHTAYSFAFLGPRPDAAQVAAQLQPWGDGRDEGWPAWAFSNHDAPRVVSRWSGTGLASFAFGGQEDAPGAETPVLGSGSPQERMAPTWMALLLALRGTVFLYQGEELGLPQSEVPFEHMQDPYGLANWPLVPGRDGCRTPMPWDPKLPSAGFSPGTPWLPCDAAHAGLAVSVQEADSGSLLHTTRRLLALRRSSPALRLGQCRVLWAEGPLLLLWRSTPAEGVLAAFHLAESPAPGAIPWAALQGVERVVVSTIQSAITRDGWCHGQWAATDEALELSPGAAVYARFHFDPLATP